MKVTVLHNQSLLDIAKQVSGRPENAIWIALENEIEPTKILKPGEVIKIPENLIIDTDVLNYYMSNTLKPATALTDQEKNMTIGNEGIGYWAIEVDFIVS